MEFIDLRSDTVTEPTPEMRRAMADAEVGDDVYGEDPTINRLEEAAAQRLGKEAGLFVTSGTMGNLLAVMSVCGRGDEVILGDEAHTFVHEVGGISALGGVHPHILPVQPDGTLALDAIRRAIRTPDIHVPVTRMIILENAQGSMTGIPVPKDYIDAVGAIAREHDLALHIDGARLFNAVTALKIDAADLVAAADSVTFCLSKGLCAPVGSVLVGSRQFIRKARGLRKMLGGGMRQAGILAAAGLIALEDMTLRLDEDHATARRFAEGIADLPQFELVSPVYTNIVYLRVKADAGFTAPELSAALLKHKIKLLAMDDHYIRIATHYWIRAEHVDLVIDAIKKELS